MIAPMGGASNAGSAAQTRNFGNPNAAEEADDAQVITGGSNPYAWGPVALSPGLSYRYTYGDGLLGFRGEIGDSTLQEISPNFDFDIGEHWFATYSPTWRIFDDDAFEDSLDHQASLNGERVLGSWTLGLDQAYSFTTPSIVEAGRQTEQEAWTTEFNAFHPFTRSFYYNSTLSQDLRYTEDFATSRNWSFANRIHYAPSAIIDYALSGVYGYTDIDPGLNMEYQQYTFGLTFSPSERTRLDLEGGVDVRRFDFSGADEFSNPIYNASLSWAPTDQSTITLFTSRSLESSLFSDTVTDNESSGIDFRQRLLDTFDINLRYDRRDVVFADENGQTEGVRDDTYESYDASISALVLYKVTLTAFFRRNENVSNVDGFEFDSDQIGFEASYQY